MTHCSKYVEFLAAYILIKTHFLSFEWRHSEINNFFPRHYLSDATIQYNASLSFSFYKLFFCI